jgi:hypothetical protein
MNEDGEGQSICFRLDKSMEGYLLSFLRDNCYIGFLWFFCSGSFPMYLWIINMNILFSFAFLLVLMNLFRFALYISEFVGYNDPALYLNLNTKKNSVYYLNFWIKINYASAHQFWDAISKSKSIYVCIYIMYIRWIPCVYDVQINTSSLK